MKLRVKNWAKFQHYKDRCPPWIKLHFDILTSRDWVMLNDRYRVLAIACMLVASRSECSDGSFDADPAYFRRVAYLDWEPSFDKLLDIGFLEFIDNLQADASGCKQTQADDTTEESREEERREEGDRSPAHQKPHSRKRKKNGFTPPSESDVIEYFKSNGYSHDAAIKAHRYYSEAEPPWHDSNGKPVRSWKQKCIAVWFKPENKIDTGGGKKPWHV